MVSTWPPEHSSGKSAYWLSPDSGTLITLTPNIFLNTTYPNAPWQLVSVTDTCFSSTSDQGFEDNIYCDDGSSRSIITTYSGLNEARITYKLNSADGVLPLYHTKLAALSPIQNTGLVLGGSFQWLGQLNQKDTPQPQVYVGANSGHFNLSPAHLWRSPAY